MTQHQNPKVSSEELSLDDLSKVSGGGWLSDAVGWVVEKVWDNSGNVKGYVDKQQDMLKKIEENSVYSPPGEEGGCDTKPGF